MNRIPTTSEELTRERAARLRAEDELRAANSYTSRVIGRCDRARRLLDYFAGAAVLGWCLVVWLALRPLPPTPAPKCLPNVMQLDPTTIRGTGTEATWL